jgi:hypothetical protein
LGLTTSLNFVAYDTDNYNNVLEVLGILISHLVLFMPQKERKMKSELKLTAENTNI